MSALEVPRTLPVTTLSVSSLETYTRCPQQWKRRYIDKVRDPASPPMVLGSTVGAALAEFFRQKMDGTVMTADEVCDTFGDELALKCDADEIDWDGKTPGDLKDAGSALIPTYLMTAQHIEPVSVERKFVITPPDADWAFLGYLDLETASGSIVDLKVKGKALSQADADASLQASAYLLGRRTEARSGWGKPADRFEFHVMKNLVKGPKVDLVETYRTDVQLDAFYARLLNVAREIAWRAEFDEWGFAVPGSWWCSERFCRNWHACPGGGAR